MIHFIDHKQIYQSINEKNKYVLYRCIGRTIYGAFKNAPNSPMKKNLQPPGKGSRLLQFTGALGLQSYEPTTISLGALFGFGGAMPIGEKWDWYKVGPKSPVFLTMNQIFTSKMVVSPFPSIKTWLFGVPGAKAGPKSPATSRVLITPLLSG